MKNLSKIKLNLIEEKLYIESLVNVLYMDIATYGEKETDIKLMIESANNEENDKEIIDDIVSDLKLTPNIIFTFGTGVSSFVSPVNSLLAGSGFNFDKRSVILLIITAIATLLNTPDAKKLIESVKEKGLYSALKGVKDLISTTKDIINAITKNTTGVLYSLSDILGFTFLLTPTNKILNELINSYGITTNSINELLSGLLFATIAYSVKAVLRKINRKFS